MRLLAAVVVLCGTFFAVAEAHPLALLGAAKGTALVGAGIAKIVASAIPAGLLLPLAIAAPLKLAVPLLLGLKTLGLLKLKLLAAPIGLGVGKVALVKAKLGLGKVALVKAGKLALLKAPFKLAALKLGLGKLALAKAGAAKLALIKAPLKLAALKLGLGKLALVKAGAAKLALIKVPLKLAALKLGAVKVALATAGTAKLALIKAPLKLAVLKLGAGKVALATAGAAAKLALIKAPIKLAALKVGAGSAALATAGAATVALAKLPVKLAAMKVGAVAGAKAGAAAGLVGSKTLAKGKLIHPMMIPPIGTLVRHRRTVKHIHRVVRPVAVQSSSYAAPEVEYESGYGARPEPAYVPPSPAAPVYRRRRDVAVDSIGRPALKEIFDFMTAMDKDRCVLRVVCDLGVDPSLAGAQGAEVTTFMTALDDDDDDDADGNAPWAEHKEASMLGRSTHSRQACQQRFSQCSKSTEELIALARQRLDSATVYSVSESADEAVTPEH